MHTFYSAKYKKDSDCKGCKHFKFTETEGIYNNYECVKLNRVVKLTDTSPLPIGDIVGMFNCKYR